MASHIVGCFGTCAIARGKGTPRFAARKKSVLIGAIVVGHGQQVRLIYLRFSTETFRVWLRKRYVNSRCYASVSVR